MQSLSCRRRLKGGVAWEMETFSMTGGVCIRQGETLKEGFTGCNGLACHDKGIGKWGQHKSLSR